MSEAISLKGYLLHGSGCGSGCGGGSASGCPWPLELGACGGGESYGQVVDTKIRVSTLPGAFVRLAEGLSRIELLALKSSGAITLRLNGAPARAYSTVNYPVAGLSGLTLGFTLDALYSVAVLFDAADDTATEIARRINAAAALAGAAYLPATVDSVTGRVVISGNLTGAQGMLSAFSGSAVSALGLPSVATVGAGQDVPVAGLFLSQFPRGLGAVTRAEVSGSAEVSFLAAGDA